MKFKRLPAWLAAALAVWMVGCGSALAAAPVCPIDVSTDMDRALEQLSAWADDMDAKVPELPPREMDWVTGEIAAGGERLAKLRGNPTFELYVARQYLSGTIKRLALMKEDDEKRRSLWNWGMLGAYFALDTGAYNLGKILNRDLYEELTRSVNNDDFIDNVSAIYGMQKEHRDECEKVAMTIFSQIFTQLASSAMH